MRRAPVSPAIPEDAALALRSAARPAAPARPAGADFPPRAARDERLPGCRAASRVLCGRLPVKGAGALFQGFAGPRPRLLEAPPGLAFRARSRDGGEAEAAPRTSAPVDGVTIRPGFAGSALRQGSSLLSPGEDRLPLRGPPGASSAPGDNRRELQRGGEHRIFTKPNAIE